MVETELWVVEQRGHDLGQGIQAPREQLAAGSVARSLFSRADLQRTQAGLVDVAIVELVPLG
jgi:hypothetical protein